MKLELELRAHEVGWAGLQQIYFSLLGLHNRVTVLVEAEKHLGRSVLPNASLFVFHPRLLPFFSHSVSPLNIPKSLPSLSLIFLLIRLTLFLCNLTFAQPSYYPFILSI